MTKRETGALEQAFEGWLEGYRSPATRRAYTLHVGHFLSVVGQAVTVESVRSYRKTLDGMSDVNLAANLSAARSFVRYCEDIGVIDKTPAALLRTPRGLNVEPRLDKTPFTVEEMAGLVQASRASGPAEHAAILLLLVGGLRVDEVCRASLADLSIADLEGNAVLHVNGKGRRQRDVKMRADVLAAVLALHGLDAVPKDAKDRPDTPLIFHGDHRPYTTSGLFRMVRRVADRAGITRKLTPHSLRRQGASMVAANPEATMFDLTSHYGWQQSDTALVYIRRMRGFQRTAVDLLPSFE